MDMDAGGGMLLMMLALLFVVYIFTLDSKETTDKQQHRTSLLPFLLALFFLKTYTYSTHGGSRKVLASLQQ